MGKQQYQTKLSGKIASRLMPLSCVDRKITKERPSDNCHREQWL